MSNKYRRATFKDGRQKISCSHFKNIDEYLKCYEVTVPIESKKGWKVLTSVVFYKDPTYGENIIKIWNKIQTCPDIHESFIWGVFFHVPLWKRIWLLIIHFFGMH